MLKVSAIIPVYNPGNNIDECISSLLGQSMSPDEHEIIFVDDGSTDETPARLDELAAAVSHVRVEHIPNSGWPGRPRNVGMDLARGEYVYFVDNDDWVGQRALERLHAAAVRHEADIVIGKVVGHGKTVPRTLFRRNRREVTIEWPPLLRLLTPHKLFRKGFLEQHGIRFPEGRRRLEDHMFVVHAYFHAGRISVVADYPCYHWMLRDQAMNVSWRPFDPVGYFDNVREVLDLVDQHTEPGPLRDQLYAHWYRGKMLGRVGGPPFVRREPNYRRELYEEIRRLAQERYGTQMDAWLPFNLRVRSRLLREGRYDSLGTLAAWESQLRADVRVREQRLADKLELELEATIDSERDPLVFVRRGRRMLWLPPETLRADLSDEDLDVTDELPKSKLDLLLRSTTDRSEYVVPTRSEIVLVRASGAKDDAKRPVLVGTAEISAHDAAAGSRLRAGDWQLLALVDVAGFTATADVIGPDRKSRFWPARRLGKPMMLTAMRDGQLRTRRPLLRRYVAHRLPRLARLVRRAKDRGAEGKAT